MTRKHVTHVTDYKPFGSGRAPENEGGALYAACQAAPESAAAIRAEFAQTVEATSRRVLKHELLFLSKECCSLTAGLLQQQINPNTMSL